MVEGAVLSVVEAPVDPVEPKGGMPPEGGTPPAGGAKSVEGAAALDEGGVVAGLVCA